jgi:hypothetical protein
MSLYAIFLKRLVPALALLPVLAFPAFGQFRVRAVAEAVDDLIEDAAVDVLAQPAFVFPDENFDQWLYQDLQNSAGARGRLNDQLHTRLDVVVASCGLSDAQRQKLDLAGRGDIKRFFDRVEELRRRFQAVKTDQNRIGEIMQAMQPLQMQLRSGIFDETSLFAKALRSTLTSDQANRFESAGRERRVFRYQAVIATLVTKLDEDLALRAAQRRELEQLLLAETRPPASFGQYDQFVAMAQMARLPEDKLRPLFDDPQWKLLQKQFEQARGLEPFLKANGFHPDSPPGAAAPQGVLAPAGPFMPVMMPAVRRVRARLVDDAP